MKIIIHKELVAFISDEEIEKMVADRHPIGQDIGLDIGQGFISISPIEEVNPFGRYGPDTDYVLYNK